MLKPQHIPVLLNEVLKFLNLKAGGKVIDATFGFGGHALAILEKIGTKGKMLGIEQDAAIIKMAPKKTNLVVAEGGFEEIKQIADNHNFLKPNAILFDLGLSLWHFKSSGRGFSFEKTSEPFSMKFRKDGPHAAELANSLTEKELAAIIREYGEESRARLFAKRILDYRKQNAIISVGDFKKAIGTEDKKILARVFQAFRIAANDELLRIKIGLEKGFDILAPEGRMAAISFHSLEDRIVKHFFKKKFNAGLCKILTKKPVIATPVELAENPSARSAKLRVIEKI